MEFYFYKKHIQQSVMKENGKINSVDLFFYSHGTFNSCGVLITFFGKNEICVNSQTNDKHGQILILDVAIDESEYILVNIYNENIESEQQKVLNDLSELIKKVLAGDFNLFFDSNLEAKGGKPILKEKSVERIDRVKGRI